MAELSSRENIWQELVKEARRRRKKPGDQADAVLREYFQRLADEKLLDESSRAARATSFRVSESEEIIRQFRKRKKRP